MWIIAILFIGAIICLSIKRGFNSAAGDGCGHGTAVEYDRRIELLTEREKEALSRNGGNILPLTIQQHQKAINGDPDAMVTVGAIYWRELDIPEKSFFWFQKASQMGYSEGKYWEGVCYNRGYGTEQNGIIGMGLILQAARAGNETALNDLKDRGMTPADMRSYEIPDSCIRKVY